MAFVVSDGQIQKLSRPSAPPSYSLRIADDYTRDYAQIWKTQSSVRTVISFLSRNIAQLGLQTFRRVSDNDRERLTDHPLALLLSRPNPTTTTYRLIEALVNDLGIYDSAYWLKMKFGGQPVAIMRLNPKLVTPIGTNGLSPEAYRLQGDRGYRDIPADQIVHFRGYSPDGDFGSPPIESLRQILAEEFEAGRMRYMTLRNGARFSGYIERPAGASWSAEARDRFSAAWKSQYAGGGPEVGGTPILEDGMTFVKSAQTAQELQYVEVRKLTREEVGSAYFIPPPMIGLLDHATFGNIEEQHKMLYQDTLGPWLTMISQEIQLQLLPDLPDSDGVYAEFNLAEKLRGSFEEQAAAMSTLVGAPVMLRNEGRARLNLPAIDGGDELITPLNVLVGGQASPRDSAPGKASPLLTKATAPASYIEQTERVLGKFFERQEAAVLSALGAKAPSWWDSKRWDRELADDLQKLAHLVADKIGRDTAESLGFDADSYNVGRTEKFLRAVAESRAALINSATLAQIEGVLADPDAGKTPADVFADAKSERKTISATTLVTTFSAFAATEAARQNAGDRATKTWLVNSGNPRPSHSAMSGETVGIDEPFSNGMNWPGDPSGGADEVAGCTCSVSVEVGNR